MNRFLHEESASIQTEGIGNPDRPFGDKINWKQARVDPNGLGFAVVRA
jgi:hypothetical protein